MNNILEEREPCIKKQLNQNKCFIYFVLVLIFAIILLSGIGFFKWYPKSVKYNADQIVQITIGLVFLLVFSITALSLLTSYLVKKHYEYMNLLLVDLKQMYDKELEHEWNMEMDDRRYKKEKAEKEDKNSKEEVEDELLDNIELRTYIKKTILSKDDLLIEELKELCNRDMLLLLAKIFKALPNDTNKESTHKND